MKNVNTDGEQTWARSCFKSKAFATIQHTTVQVWGEGQSHMDLVFRDPNFRQAPGLEGAIIALWQLAPPSKAPKVQPHGTQLHTERFLNIHTLRGWLTVFPKMRRVGGSCLISGLTCGLGSAIHVNMSFRPAKPTGEQAPAEGQERHTCWHFLGPGYTDLDPLSWDSEDVAFRSLNPAPKAVPAFGKKSQSCVPPWSYLSLLPAFTQGQGTL